MTRIDTASRHFHTPTPSLLSAIPVFSTALSARQVTLRRPSSPTILLLRLTDSLDLAATHPERPTIANSPWAHATAPNGHPTDGTPPAHPFRPVLGPQWSDPPRSWTLLTTRNSFRPTLSKPPSPTHPGPMQQLPTDTTLTSTPALCLVPYPLNLCCSRSAA